MGRRLQIRTVMEEERQAVARTAHSRTAQAWAVKRARVVLAAHLLHAASAAPRAQCSVFFVQALKGVATIRWRSVLAAG